MSSAPATLATGLAPMEGVTEFPMRLWMALAGAPSAMTTPFLRVTATYPSGAIPPAFVPELDLPASACPWTITPQLMATEPASFTRVATRLERAAVIELNCGCPSPIVSGKGAGSGLLRDPPVFGALVEALVRCLGGERIAVKMRVGFDEPTEFAELIRVIATLPIARLTIHGRTRSQGYRGRARWDLIAEAAASLPFPVIASGDVVDEASLQALQAQAPAIRGVLIGRGALRNPWVFSALRDKSQTRIRLATIVTALTVHAQLHELGALETTTLQSLAREHLFARACGTDHEAWLGVAKRLRIEIARLGDAPPKACRWAVSRTKLLWHHLRTSLPAPFFAPQLFRLHTVPELLAGVTAIGKAHGWTEVPLAHAPTMDRLFSGEKVPAQ